MEHVTDRDSFPAPRWYGRRAAQLTFVFGALAITITVALVIQLFARYQYVVNNGTVWRIDRITQQACRVIQGRVDCNPPPSSTSVSTSVSPSLSTSVSSRAKAHGQPKKT
jgi:hypothetical protein